MRYLLLASLSLLAACPINPDATEPSQPLPPDAPAVDPSPTQTPNALVLAASYDRYCMRDDDCVAAFEGNACQSDRCANAAIRRDALPEYRAEIGAYWSCYEPHTSTCSAVIGDPAICVAGKCTLPGM